MGLRVPATLRSRANAFGSSIRQDGFARSVVVLAGGTATAQAINVAMSPVITRLFSPADVGRIGLYLVFVDLAVVGLLLRLEIALVSGKTEREAAQLALLAVVTLPATVLIAAALLYVLVARAIGGYEALPVISAGWMAVTLSLAGVVAVLRYWLVRTGEFRPISQSVVLQNVARAGTQVGLGVAGLGWVGLLAADLLGRVGAAGVTARVAAGRIVRSAGPVRSLPAGRLLRQYWRFPVLSVPSSFLDALTLALPVPLISSLYGVDAAGLFVFVQTVLALPTAVIGASVADAFHGRLAELARETPEHAPRLFWRTCLALLLIGAPVTIVVMITGPVLFDLAFGERWHPAASLIPVMAPWALASLVVSPLSRVIFVYEGQAFKAVYDVFVLTLVVGSLGWSAGSGMDLTGAVTVLSAVRVFAYGIYLVILTRLVRREQRRPPLPPDGPLLR